MKCVFPARFEHKALSGMLRFNTMHTPPGHTFEQSHRKVYVERIIVASIKRGAFLTRNLTYDETLFDLS